MNRLGIFMMYDAHGMVGGYREYLLSDMMQNLSELYIVCNGFMQEAELDKLRKFTNNMFVRENKGYDAGAIKAALCEYIGWDKLKEYDELVIFNDTFYGPLYPLKVMFDEMSTRNVDFWGMYKHRIKGIPHIQSFFFCIKANMHCSDTFKSYWTKLDVDFKDLKDAVEKYEYVFTKHFEDNGFTWDVYINPPLIEKDNQHTFNISHKLISQYNSPIIKRRALAGKFEFVDRTDFISESTTVAFDYIKRHSNYDVNLIFEDLLRRHSVFELIRDLNFFYTLPSFSPGDTLTDEYSAAVVVNAEHVKFIDELAENVLRIPELVDVYVSVTDFSVVQELKNRFKQENRSNVTVDLHHENKDVMSLFNELEINRYDYVCCINEQSSDDTVKYISESYCSWHNMIGTDSYISNVIDVFEQNPKLGVLTAPIPCHSGYLSLLDATSNAAVEVSEYLRNNMGLKVITAPENAAGLNTNAFWLRTAALRTILEGRLSADAFPEGFLSQNKPVGVICPFIAQHEGYYTGVLMSAAYAGLELSNSLTAMRTIANALEGTLIFDSTNLREASISTGAIAANESRMIDNIDAFYLFGAGKVGERYYKRLTQRNKSIKGFIVSDGHKKRDSYLGCPVYEVSELVSCAGEVNIIIAVASRRYDEVRELLEREGFVNVFR